MSGLEDAGQQAYELVRELYPFCRSISGEGLRETLRRIRARIPIEICEVPTGSKVLDWTIPKEWNIRDAWVEDRSGRRVIDFRNSNLHVVGYSAPIRRTVSRAELLDHLHTLPDHPDWIPYRNSFWDESWGFCTTHRQLETLVDDAYEVCIDATLQDGSLSYGELLIPGEDAGEFLISIHVCHPSLCNDNLSGIAVGVALAQELARESRRFTYRFVFTPATIGAIAWLAGNEPVTRRVRHGLVLACVGDRGHVTYKRSRRGDAPVDRAFAHVLEHAGAPFAIEEFSPYGYDQRQYCSPGFDLPVGCLMRTPNGRYPEYHTSADDLDLVDPAAMADSLAKTLGAISVLERDRRYRNLSPKGEPQLRRRGLFEALGGIERRRDAELALLWVLNYSDGRHSLLDIAERSRLPFGAVHAAARALESTGLLAEE